MPTDTRTAARRSGKPIAAIVSQGIVAGSSLLLQLIAYFQLGEDGLGRFAVLFGILITVNSIQSGWLGDSLTVLDRFDPGIRRALVRSQLAIVGLVFVSTTILATFIGGIGDTTAVLFGIASVAWVVEETLRRLLIARRDFTNLVINDAAFAIGSFGLVGFVALTGGDFTIETLVLALLAGAVVAIGVGVVQLPSHELSRGLLGPSRMREMASFAVWRAAQIGLRPGSQTIVRFVIIAVASEAALGQLEAARLLLAPVLTVVNGADITGLYTPEAVESGAVETEEPQAAFGREPDEKAKLRFSTTKPADHDLTEFVNGVNAARVEAGTEPVEFDAKFQENWLGGLLSWVVLFGIIALFWVFILRRMGGPGQQVLNIGKNKATLGVGIVNLDRKPLAAGQDVLGAEGIAVDRVFHGGDQHAQLQRQAKRHDHMRKPHDSGCTTHVFFHQAHGATGLDIQPASVKTHALTYQGQLWPCVAPTHIQQARRARGGTANGMDHRKIGG